MYSLFYSLTVSFQTMQYSYRFFVLNIMAQTCSPCSIPLCGKTVTKTRLEVNAEVMVIIHFSSFIYMLDNSQIWPVTAKHNNNNYNNKYGNPQQSAS
jgi:hypothetical protein